MLPVFQRMARHTLEKLGEDALFDGASEPVKVNIEHGVAMQGLDGERSNQDGQMATHEDIATIESRHNPKARQCFTQNGKRWRLESLLHDNGAVRRFIVFPI